MENETKAAKNNPVFYVDGDAIQGILNQKIPGAMFPVSEFYVDLIEIPIYFAYKADGSLLTLDVYQRGEMYTHDGLCPKLGTAMLNLKTKQGSVKISNKELAEQAQLFLAICTKISAFSAENKLATLLEGMETEKAGILFDVENGELKAEVVSWKDRPNLMCTTLFGPAKMCRPYMDEIAENSIWERTSLEEKIEIAKSGDKDAIRRLAMEYLNGVESDNLEVADVPQDAEESAFWMKKLAEADDAEGMFNYGLFCAKGYGVKRNFEEAAYWMQRAKEAGDEDAAASIEFYKQAAEAKRGAEAGDADAQAKYSAILTNIAGSLDQAGPEKDLKEAFEWAQKSAAAFNLEGIWALALCYDNGRYVEQDQKKAVRLFERAAENGHAASMVNLATHLLDGTGIEKDEEAAIRWMEKSASLGYVLAMENLARKAIVVGEAPNLQEAANWYEKILEIEPNHVNACQSLSQIYMELYKATPQQAAEKAFPLYKRAFDNGYKEEGPMYNLFLFERDMRAHNALPEDMDTTNAILTFMQDDKIMEIATAYDGDWDAFAGNEQ